MTMKQVPNPRPILLKIMKMMVIPMIKIVPLRIVIRKRKMLIRMNL